MSVINEMGQAGFLRPIIAPASFPSSPVSPVNPRHQMSHHNSLFFRPLAVSKDQQRGHGDIPPESQHKQSEMGNTGLTRNLKSQLWTSAETERMQREKDNNKRSFKVSVLWYKVKAWLRESNESAKHPEL